MTLRITECEFKLLSDLIERECGILLGANKAYLIENRLSRLAEENSCVSFGELYLKAKTKTVAYDQLKMWVDKGKKLPTKIECLTEAGMLIKTMYFKDIKDFGGGLVRPADIETDSPLYKGYKSVMLFAGLKRKEYKDEVFTLTYMDKMETLR